MNIQEDGHGTEMTHTDNASADEYEARFHTVHNENSEARTDNESIDTRDARFHSTHDDDLEEANNLDH